MRGKLIAFEGIDGSGKATQADFLIRNLQRNGYKTKLISFPQYGESVFSAFVERYLRGEFGESVDPYVTSLFYAGDRFEAREKILKWLEQDYIVVCNRYYGSNIGHQGGKVDKKDLPKFLKWLEKLEFKVFGIPKPDITVFLHIPYTLSKFMVSKKPKRGYLKGKSFDIHEQSSEHLKRSFEAYMFALKKYNSWVKIDCTSGGKMLLRNQIADKIWLEVRKKLEWS